MRKPLLEALGIFALYVVATFVLGLFQSEPWGPGFLSRVLSPENLAYNLRLFVVGLLVVAVVTGGIVIKELMRQRRMGKPLDKSEPER